VELVACAISWVCRNSVLYLFVLINVIYFLKHIKYMYFLLLLDCAQTKTRISGLSSIMTALSRVRGKDFFCFFIATDFFFFWFVFFFFFFVAEGGGEMELQIKSSGIDSMASIVLFDDPSFLRASGSCAVNRAPPNEEKRGGALLRGSTRSGFEEQDCYVWNTATGQGNLPLIVNCVITTSQKASRLNYIHCE
jgi:hypothetical protein